MGKVNVKDNVKTGVESMMPGKAKVGKVAAAVANLAKKRKQRKSK